MSQVQATELETLALGTAAREFGRRIAALLLRGRADVSLQRALAEAASLALVRSAQGHAFLDFDGPVLLPCAQESSTRFVQHGPEVVAYEGHRSLLGVLAESKLLQANPAPGELLVLERSRLYLRKMWQDEVQLAAWLSARMTVDRAVIAANSAVIATNAAWLDPLLRAAFDDASPPEQIAAVRQCVNRSFGVIVGGPGTGKTFVVARLLLAAGVAYALKHGAAPRVLLLAPTGKASRRVDLSVSMAMESLREPVMQLLDAWSGAPPVPGAHKALQHAAEQVRALRGCASTIHAALKSDPRGADLFRHGPEKPLPADIVVVDEASMVSLSLMRALCMAVAPSAQLVLLGDRGQLQSVEAGSVLADIGGEDEEETAGSVFRLAVSRRFPQQSGLGRLAASVRTGATSEDGNLVAMNLLDHDPEVRAQVTLMEPEPGRTTAHAVELGVARLASLRDTTLTPARRLEILESFALLCGHRRGPGGADEVNAALVRRWAPPSARDGRPFDGMPVLVLRNSADLGLANGDLGVVCADATGALHAYFDGERRVRAEMLPEFAPAYALTVHKSQGSEYGSLALVLPERESPVLTRELIYTALTRWKAHGHQSGVTIIARRTVLEAALKSRVQRASGLRERIRI